MEHHVARDLLTAYVEDDLEADTKTELERHLEECDECRALLNEAEAPVDLTSAVTERDLVWDEKRMRKTVRRTLLRVVSGVISIWPFTLRALRSNCSKERNGRCAMIRLLAMARRAG